MEQVGQPADARRPVRSAAWRARPDVLADVALALAFSLLLIVQIANHEMWRDEIHSWGLVLDSPTLADLYANLRYTGHPGLWYMLLWLASWATQSPFAVQVVHAAIGMLLIGTIAFLSPFRRLEKVLLLCSYFVIFEYTVVSRNYGIGMLLAFVYAHFRATRPRGHLLNCFLLGLLANTSLFGLVISAALAFEYVLAGLTERGASMRDRLAGLLPGFSILACLALISIATIWPAADMSWQATGEPLANAFDPMRLLIVAMTNLSALVPIGALDYWAWADDSYFTESMGISTPFVLLACAPVLAAIYVRTFREAPRLLCIPALTAVGAVAIGQLIYLGTIRHWGVHFVAFVAALWMKQVWFPARVWAATLLLAISALAGVAVSVQQAPLTFSHAEATARWIRDSEPDALLVGTPDTIVAPVAQFLGRSMYFLDCGCTDTYAFYGNRRDAFQAGEIAQRLDRALRDLGASSALFIIDRPLGDGELAELGRRGIEAAKLVEFVGSPTRDDFRVYRATRR